jgi:small subunit ribosomal protein S20
MANIKSAKKRAEQTIVRTERNISRKNRIRTFVRKLQDLIKSGDKEKSLSALSDTQSEIMKGVTKGVIKLNTASRKVSRLTQAIAKM